MENRYYKERTVEYTDVDYNANLGIINMFNYAQDNGTVFFKNLGTDNLVMREKFGFAWVVTKTKLINFVTPKWRTDLKCEAYVTEIGKIRMTIENVFRDIEDNICFIVEHEFCLIDINKKTVEKIAAVNFPEIELRESVGDYKFDRLKDVKISEGEEFVSRKVSLSNIDFSKHTNNASYIAFMVDCFDGEFANKNKIKEIDAQYIKETREKDILKIYRKDIENSTHIIMTNDADEVVFKSKIIYEK